MPVDLLLDWMQWLLIYCTLNAMHVDLLHIGCNACWFTAWIQCTLDAMPVDSLHLGYNACLYIKRWIQCLLIFCILDVRIIDVNSWAIKVIYIDRFHFHPTASLFRGMKKKRNVGWTTNGILQFWGSFFHEHQSFLLPMVFSFSSNRFLLYRFYPSENCKNVLFKNRLALFQNHFRVSSTKPTSTISGQFQIPFPPKLT